MSFAHTAQTTHDELIVGLDQTMCALPLLVAIGASSFGVVLF
jgi:hypothetical protein